MNLRKINYSLKKPKKQIKVPKPKPYEYEFNGTKYNISTASTADLVIAFIGFDNIINDYSEDYYSLTYKAYCKDVIMHIKAEIKWRNYKGLAEWKDDESKKT